MRKVFLAVIAGVTLTIILAACDLFRPPVNFNNPYDPDLSYEYDGPRSLDLYPNDEGIPLPTKVDVTRDGRTLFAVSHRTDKVYVQDLVTGSLEAYASGHDLSPDVDLAADLSGDRVFIVQNTDIFVFDRASGVTDLLREDPVSEDIVGADNDYRLMGVTRAPSANEFYASIEIEGDPTDDFGMLVFDGSGSTVREEAGILELSDMNHPPRAFAATDSYIAVGTLNSGIMLLDRNSFEVAGSMYEESSTWVSAGTLPPTDVRWLGGLAHISGDRLAAVGENVFQPVLSLDPALDPPVEASSSYGDYGSGPLGFDNYNVNNLGIGADETGEIYVVAPSRSRIYRMVAGDTAVDWPDLSDGAIGDFAGLADDGAGEIFVLDGELSRVVRIDTDGSRSALTDIGALSNPQAIAANSSEVVVYEPTIARKLSRSGAVIETWSSLPDTFNSDIELLEDGRAVYIRYVDSPEPGLEYYLLGPGGSIDGPRAVNLGGLQPEDERPFMAADESDRLYLAVGLSDGNVVYGSLDLGTGGFDPVLGTTELRSGLDIGGDIDLADFTYTAGHLWMLVPQAGTAIRFDAQSGAPRGSLSVAGDSGDWQAEAIFNYQEWFDGRMAVGPDARLIVADPFNATLRAFSPR
jgi:hypothetical protein